MDSYGAVTNLGSGSIIHTPINGPHNCHPAICYYYGLLIDRAGRDRTFAATSVEDEISFVFLLDLRARLLVDAFRIVRYRRKYLSGSSEYRDCRRRNNNHSAEPWSQEWEIQDHQNSQSFHTLALCSKKSAASELAGWQPYMTPHYTL
jgi:hypothetical protein